MRPRKAPMNGVVSLREGGFGVVVEYRKTQPRYRVVRSDNLGRYPHRSAWYDSSEIRWTGRRSIKAGRIYRANARIGAPEVRGCDCNCCAHVRGVEPEPRD